MSKSDRDIVWIPSVPLPFLGRRTDTCSCGMKFRGKGRRAAYELHYRREHQRGDTSASEPQMAVTRAEARRIYDEVNADSPDVPPEHPRAENGHSGLQARRDADSGDGPPVAATRTEGTGAAAGHSQRPGESSSGDSSS